MNRSLTMLAALAPWLTGCALTVRTTATSRIEQVQSALAPSGASVRVASVTTIAPARGDGMSVELAPQLMQGGTSGLRLRAAARWTGTDAWHPAIAVSVEDGTTRTAELVSDSSGRLPSAPTLHARQLRGDAGLRINRGRRMQVTVRLGVARSEGIGADAASLPVLAATSLEARGTWNATRHTSLGATLRMGTDRVGDAPSLASTRLLTTAQWTPARAFTVTTTAGAVAVGGGVRPSVEIGLTRTLPFGARLAATVARTPEVDRLNGALTDRIRARVRFETPLVPHVSFRGTLQESADQDGRSQRVVRSGDAGFAFDMGRAYRAEIGVARFQQYMASVHTNSESRAFLQFSFAPTR